ncbi:hypothetical protein G7046_g9466 [Stylonectria norvegica]|nr:hypothetical protein G7046_g9466 [Stylonectria norvegica]
MASILIVGATRGLGASLLKQYAAKEGNTVYGTTRSSKDPDGFPREVKWLTGVDLTDSGVGDAVVKSLGASKPLSTVVSYRDDGVHGWCHGQALPMSKALAHIAQIITAGYFNTEDLSADKGPNWDDELRTYTTSSIAPVFIVHRLVHAGLLQKDSKVVLVSSESGSITLRHEEEGGGNYAHHASKAALNMVGKLLSLDLKDKGVVVSIVHPGFMRTEMTKGVGFDKYWDDGGAVTPDVAAGSLVEWTDALDISKTGEYWAPRGPGDIGTAEVVLGKNLSTPLKLPW